MHVSLADYSQTWIDQLGVCFMNGKTGYNSADVITDQEPVYIKIEKEVGRDIQQWHRISTTYRAQGGEMYLLIGSFAIHKVGKTKFKAPKGVKTRINQTTGRDAYYYVDDVSLVEIESPPLPDTLKTELKSVDTLPSDKPLVFRNVLFQVNRSEFLESSYPELDALAQYLEKHPYVSIIISGHTDNSGNEKKNKKLSEGRAKSVSDYLIKNKIDKSRVSFKGYGSSKPIASNETEEGKQQNRRVEFVITK
jgi:outer membrane protein OmpA-like peptidoglycan-associated protein